MVIQNIKSVASIKIDSENLKHRDKRPQERIFDIEGQVDLSKGKHQVELGQTATDAHQDVQQTFSKMAFKNLMAEKRGDKGQGAEKSQFETVGEKLAGEKTAAHKVSPSESPNLRQASATPSVIGSMPPSSDAGPLLGSEMAYRPGLDTAILAQASQFGLSGADLTAAAPNLSSDTLSPEQRLDKIKDLIRTNKIFLFQDAANETTKAQINFTDKNFAIRHIEVRLTPQALKVDFVVGNTIKPMADFMAKLQQDLQSELQAQLNTRKVQVRRLFEEKMQGGT